MDTPANTISYMIAGFAVIFGGLLAYLASLALRFRRLQQQEKMLEAAASRQKHSPHQE